MQVIDSYRQAKLTPAGMRKTTPASSTALSAGADHASREK